jgi:predicted metal-dependent peptidase
MNRQAKNRLETAVSILISFSPLYGTVFFSLNKVQNDSIPTMGVGPIRKVDIGLYYNPDFVMSLTKQELIAVLKHEALHLLLHHLERAKLFSYHHKLFNIAADLAINSHIENLPQGALYPKNYELEEGLSADKYYAILKKEQEENGNGKGDGKGKGKGPLSDLVNGDQDTLDDHSLWDDFDKDIINEKIRRIAERAVKEQEKRGWGSVSGNLVSQILEANKPKVNWKKEVRYFIGKLVVMGRKSTRMRDNRRTYELYPYLNPGSKRRYTSRLLVAFDTSGSVSDKKLELFVNELSGMIDQVIVDTIMFDTQVYDQPKPFKRKKQKVEIVGRGGTCFEPVVRLADELKYDGLIIFTDGDAPIPQKPKCRVMWCLTSSDANRHNFAYGKKVVIED